MSSSIISLLFAGLSSSTKSYTLKKITDMLDSESIKYNVVKNRFDLGYSTGCRVSFDGSDIIVSVQTSPNIAGDSFCETALIRDGNMLYIPQIGYSDCIRHIEPLNFLCHIRELKNLITGRDSITFNDSISSVESSTNPTSESSFDSEIE